MANRVRELRKKAKLSQRALAEAVYVSQATIQRIEAEATPISLSIAQRIADHFGKPLRTVFPTVPKEPRAEGLANDEDDSIVDARSDEVIRFRMRDRRDLVYVVDGRERDRLERIVYQPEGKTFLVFTSQGKQVALRRSEVRYMATHDDPMFEVPEDKIDPDMSGYMSITFLGETEAESFLVSGDNVDPDDPDKFEEAIEENHLAGFLMSLDSAQDGDDFTTAEILDTDGCDDDVRIVFPFDQILLVEMPLSLLNPRLRRIEWEDEEETEQARKPDLHVVSNSLH